MALEPIHLPLCGGSLRLDAEGLTRTVQTPGLAARTDRTPWSAVEAAGLVATRRSRSTATASLLLAVRDGRRRQELELVLPAAGFACEMALAHLRAALGPRFDERPLPYGARRRQLGLTSWWIWPAIVLLVLLVLYAPLACRSVFGLLAR